MDDSGAPIIEECYGVHNSSSTVGTPIYQQTPLSNESTYSVYYNTGEYHKVDNHADFDHQVADMTISHWVKVDSYDSSGTYLVSKFGSSTGVNREWLTYYTSTTNYFSFYVWGSSNCNVDATDKVPAGSNTLLTGVTNGTALMLYLNGTLNNTNYCATNPLNGSYDVYFGDSPVVSRFIGDLDEVIIWNNKSLTAEEVGNLFSYGDLGASAADCNIVNITLPVNATNQTTPFDITVNHTSCDVGMTNFSLWQFNGTWGLAAYNETAAVPASKELFFSVDEDSGSHSDCHQYSYWIWNNDNSSVGNVTGVGLYMNKIGAPSNSTVYIREQSGGKPSSSSIVQGTINASDADDAWTYIPLNDTWNKGTEGFYAVFSENGNAGAQVCNHYSSNKETGTQHRGYCTDDTCASSTNVTGGTLDVRFYYENFSSDFTNGTYNYSVGSLASYSLPGSGAKDAYEEWNNSFGDWSTNTLAATEHGNMTWNGSLGGQWVRSDDANIEWAVRDFNIPHGSASNTSFAMRWDTCGSVTNRGFWYRVNSGIGDYCFKINCVNNEVYYDYAGANKKTIISSVTTGEWYNLTIEYINNTGNTWVRTYINGSEAPTFAGNRSHVECGGAVDATYTFMGPQDDGVNGGMNYSVGEICVDSGNGACSQENFFNSQLTTLDMNYFYAEIALANNTIITSNASAFDYALGAAAAPTSCTWANVTYYLPLNSTTQNNGFNLQVYTNSCMPVTQLRTYQYNGSWNLHSATAAPGNGTNNFTTSTITGGDYDYFYSVLELANGTEYYSNDTEFDYGLYGFQGCTWANTDIILPLNNTWQANGAITYDLQINTSACVPMNHLEVWRHNGSWNLHAYDSALGNGTDNYSVTPLSGLNYTYYYAMLALDNGTNYYSNGTSFDYSVNENPADNDTQYIVHYGPTYTDIAGEDQAGSTNATHFNEAYHAQFKAGSAIGMSYIEVWQDNGGWALLDNITIGLANNTAFNSSTVIHALTEQAIPVYACVYAVNGSSTCTYSASKWEYYTFYDTTAPTVNITAPNDNATVYRLNSDSLDAYADDDWLLNATLDIYYYNGTLAWSKYQNTPDPHGSNTTLYFNETLFAHNTTYCLGGNMTANLSAFDSHTKEQWEASKVKKTLTSFQVKKNEDYFDFNVGLPVRFSELYDRIKFEWTENVKPTQVFVMTKEGGKMQDKVVDGKKVGDINRDIIVNSPHYIKIIENSNWTGHLVSGKLWADFQDLADEGFKVKVTRINNTAVKVNVLKKDVGIGNVVCDPSVGGLNWASKNISYFVANYTTTMPRIWLNDTYPSVNDVVLISADYNHSNGTAITGANCTLTVHNSLGNTSYYMNTTYNFDYQVNQSGSHTFFAECGKQYYDNAHNQTHYFVDGFRLRAFDEKTNATLTFNITMTNSSGCSYFNSSQDEFFWPNATGSICTGAVSVTITASGYQPRNYYYTWGVGAPIDAIVYLLADGEGVYSYFTVVDRGYNTLSGARITFFRSYDGGTSYVTVAQQDTDSFGSASFYLDPFTTYYMTVVLGGYDPYSAYLTPQPTTYVIVLGGGTNTTIWNASKVMARTYPQTVKYYDNITFAVDCYDGNILNFTLQIFNNTMDEIWSHTTTGSPAGGVITVNTTELPWFPNSTDDGFLYSNGTWNYNGTDPGVFMKHIRNIRDFVFEASGTLSVLEGINKLEDSMEVATLNERKICSYDNDGNIVYCTEPGETNRNMATNIISLFVITFTTAGISQRFGFGAAMVGIPITGFFMIIGWLTPAIGLLAMFLAGAAYVTRRYV